MGRGSREHPARKLIFSREGRVSHRHRPNPSCSPWGNNCHSLPQNLMTMKSVKFAHKNSVHSAAFYHYTLLVFFYFYFFPLLLLLSHRKVLLPEFWKKSDMFSDGIILFSFSGRNSTQRKRHLSPVSCIHAIATNGVCYSVRDDSTSKRVMQVVVQKSCNKLHFHRCMLCWARFRIIPITLTGFSAWDLQTVREHSRTLTETPIVEMDVTGRKLQEVFETYQKPLDVKISH